MIRHVLSLILGLLLAACNTAGPGFRGKPATQITVDGSVFEVRVAAGRAEAMRVNAQYAPRFGPIRARAAQAMALVSGCDVSQVSGDQALATGVLDCGHGPPHPEPSQPPKELDCTPVRGSALMVLGQVQIDLDCTPV